MDGTGKYRTRGIDGAPNTVRVVDKSISLDMPEQLYVQRGYSPPIDDLPWNEEPPQARKEATSRGNGRRRSAQ
jgi:hypothetical protein